MVCELYPNKAAKKILGKGGAVMDVDMDSRFQEWGPVAGYYVYQRQGITLLIEKKNIRKYLFPSKDTLLILVYTGSCNKNTGDWMTHKQHKFIAHRSRGWEV